jgi:putative DNA-invertase from lambdoid prophage Rac
MARVAYLRVSGADQSVESQRKALGGSFEREFVDAGVSGGVMAAHRPGFAELLSYVREGDTCCVYAVDRLGRDALDVMSTVRALMAKGVVVDVLGIGPIAGGVGELVLAVLAQISSLERERIRERCESGRQAARVSLAATNKTHRGKSSLGRPKACDASVVASWRAENAASISVTAEHFGISHSTVKRCCATA